MPRLNDIEQKYIEKLIEFANQYPNYGSEHEIWKSINQADPDQQRHIHTRWLLERTLSDNPKKRILWEDIAAGANSKAHEILKRFLTIRPLLPHDKRNLYRYGNLSDVTAVIRPLESIKTPGELKAEERERVDQETVILYEEHGYKVLVPMSEEASCYWGRGTEWCTAATKSDNAFQSYHQKGPLVIVITPDGKKVQLHKNSAPMDENDKTLKNVTDPILISLCAYYGRVDVIDSALCDRELCLFAVNQHGMGLWNVPLKFRDRDVCLAAVTQNGEALYSVPEYLRDREMCLFAVNQHGGSLKHVPLEMRDHEICLTAVNQHGWALEYVPKDLHNHEICLAAVTQNGYVLPQIPKEFRDKEMCLQAVKQDGWALSYVPKDLLRDRDMCLAAVTQNGEALWCIPKEYRDREMCFTAIKSNGMALGDVPLEFRDYDMCFTAVQSNGYALGDAPIEFRDSNMCFAAIKSNEMALEYVPKDLHGNIIPFMRKDVTPKWLQESTIMEDLRQTLSIVNFDTVPSKLSP